MGKTTANTIKPDNRNRNIFEKKWSYMAILFVWLVFVGSFFFRGHVPFPSTYLVSFFPPWSAYFGMAVKNNAMPDIITQIYPWKKLTVESWGMNQVPLWNPYSFSGTVHAGNYQSAVFSPLNGLFTFLPFIDAWTLLVLLQPLIAGIGMCFFLRTINRSQYAQVIGSLSFMFCGFITTWMGYGTLGYAIALLPFALGAIVNYQQTKQWWTVLVIACSIFLSFSSGHYQISLYFLGVIWAFILLCIPTLKMRLILFAITLIGIGLSLPQLLVTFQAFIHSNRSESFITQGSIPWSYLVTLFSPDFYGNPVTRNDWFGQYAEWSSYIGVLPLFFSFYALFYKKNSYTRFFLILSIVSILLAMQTPFNNLLYALRIPILSTSVATRMIVLVSFSLAVLSAFGIDYLRHHWNGKERVAIKALFGSVLFLAILWVTLLFLPNIPEEYRAVAKRNSIIPSIILVVSIVCASISIRWKRSRSFVLLFFVVLTAGEMLRFTLKWMPQDPKEFVYPNIDSIAYLQKTIGVNRVYGTFGNELNTYYQIPSIEGYDAMYQQRYGEFISASGDGTIGDLQRSVVQLDKSGKYSEKILQLLGVRYIFHRITDGRNIWAYPFWNYDHYTKIYADSGYEIFENAQALPRTFLVSKYLVRKDKQEIITTLFSDDFPYREAVVLENVPTIEPELGEGTAVITTYTSNRIQIITEATSPKILVLSDVYDSGWNAYINGIRTPIQRANYAFRAISVPEGKHIIEFKYEPKEFRYGVLGAVISIGVLLGIMVRHMRINSHRFGRQV